MTDPKNPDDTRDPAGAPDELPQDIQAVFERWDAQRQPPTADPLEALGDYPLTEDELALDHEISQTPEQMLQRARKAARYRLVFTIVLALAGTAALWFNRGELAYFAQTEDDIVDMGDLRQRYRAGDRRFEELAHNKWVSFENAIMTEEREGRSNTYYFFDPMTHMIVVTPRPLPDKPARLPTIHSAFTDLHAGRWILPYDMAVSFSGKGRLLRASDAPRRYRALVATYRDLLHLDDRLGADATLWIFLDEVAPTDQTIYVVIFGVVVLVLLLSLGFWWRASRRVRELSDAIASGSA